MRYLLLKAKEGALWKDMVYVASGTDENTLKQEFSERERPFILWWLFDMDKLPHQVINIASINEMFMTYYNTDGVSLDKHDYKIPPVVGFYDMIATERSWGLLKDWE